MKEDKNWVSVLKNYQLMADAHYENDAQNWHIIGVELVSKKEDTIKELFIFVHLFNRHILSVSVQCSI